MVVLGDRYELIASTFAATIARIPLCHFHGGEQTQGIIDDVIRNCITKLSHIHFAANEKYRKRIIQMGENSKYVFNVGSLGVENIRKNKTQSKEFLEKKYKIKISKPFCIITFHPETSKVKIDSNETLARCIEEYKRFKNDFYSPGADHGFKNVYEKSFVIG